MKLLPATCSAGAVVADEIPIEAEILSEGVGESEGVVLLDGPNAYYLPKSSPNLAATLEHLIEALTQTKEALDKTVEALEKSHDALAAVDTHAPLVTSCGAGVGTATWTPVAAADIAGILTASTAVTTAANAIEAAKDELQTLSEELV